MLQSLRDKVALPEDELGRLVALAQPTAPDNHDHHRFTSVLNERFSQAQKT